MALLPTYWSAPRGAEHQGQSWSSHHHFRVCREMAGMGILVADTPEPNNRPQRHAEGKVDGTVSNIPARQVVTPRQLGECIKRASCSQEYKLYALPTDMEIEACIAGHIPLSFYRLYSCTVDTCDVTKACVLLQNQTASISHRQDSTTGCSSRTCTA